MDNQAKLFGHPVHRMLVVFPLALLATALLLDVATLLMGAGHWSDISFRMIGAGILTGLAAAPFGVLDWLAIPSGTRAKRVGAIHGIGNVIVLLLYTFSWLIRLDNPTAPGDLAFIASFAGSGLALATGWLGGELVDRLAVGVDAEAHLSAARSPSARRIPELIGPSPHQAGRAARGHESMSSTLRRRSPASRGTQDRKRRSRALPDLGRIIRPRMSRRRM